MTDLLTAAEATTEVLVTSGLYALLGVGIYVWFAAALAALFRKLGAPTWKAWVPVANTMELYQLGGVPGWSVVFYFIPVVNLYGFYLMGVAIHRINLSFGRGTGSTVLGVLALPVWASILGWGKEHPNFDAARTVRPSGDPSAPMGPLAQPDQLPTWAGQTGTQPPQPATSGSPWAPTDSNPNSSSHVQSGTQGYPGDPALGPAQPGYAVPPPPAQLGAGYQMPHQGIPPQAPPMPMQAAQDAPPTYSFPPVQEQVVQQGQVGQPVQQSQFGQPVQQGQFGQPVEQIQPGQQGQFGQPGQQGQFGQPGQQGQFGQPGQQGQFGQPGQQGQFGQPGQQGQFGQPGQQGQFGQPGQQGQFGQPGQQGQFGQPGLQGQFGQPVHQSQTGQFGQPSQPEGASPAQTAAAPTSYSSFPTGSQPASHFQPPSPTAATEQPTYTPAMTSAQPAEDLQRNPVPAEAPFLSQAPGAQPGVAGQQGYQPSTVAGVESQMFVPQEPQYPAPSLGYVAPVAVPVQQPETPGTYPLAQSRPAGLEGGQGTVSYAQPPDDGQMSAPQLNAPAHPAPQTATEPQFGQMSAPQLNAPAHPAPQTATEPQIGQASALGQPVFDQRQTTVIRPDEDIEGTVMVRRAEFQPWMLSLDDGRRFEIMARTVVVGRRPSAGELGVQALAVADDTRTMSKTHARFDLVDGVWHVTDLASTNGVTVVGPDGAEAELEPGRATVCGGRVVLGAVGMTLSPLGDRL